MKALIIIGILATGDLSSDRPRSGLHDFVGSYYHGDGLGTNCTLTIKKDGRFSYIWTGCTGVYEKNEGQAEVAGGGVLFHQKQPPMPGLKTRYVSVRPDHR